MAKKTIKMISAFVALGVVVGGYLGVRSYVDRMEARENQSTDEQKTAVFASDQSDIMALKFLIDKNEVVFKKEDNQWIKEDETSFPVNQDKLSEAAAAFTSLEADRVLENVSDLEEYELDNPSNTITVTTSEGETVFRIGMKNESTNQYYVNKNEDKETVYVVESAAFDPFMYSLYDYAQGEEFPSIESTYVSRIKVDQASSSYELAKDDSGLWQISDGEISDKADSARASSLPSYLASMVYDSFVDYNCTDDSKYGLADPYATITVDYKEGKEEDTSSDPDTDSETAKNTSEDPEEEKEPELEEKELILAVGSESGSDARYVKLDGSRQIYTMSDETLSSFLDKSISDFWDLTVNYLSVNRLDHLKLNADGVSHEIDVSRETIDGADGETTEELTYLLDGEELENETVFTTFYNKLINMSAQEKLMEEYKSEKPSVLEVEFVDTDGQTTNVGYFEYDDNFYAAVTDHKVFLLNKMSVRDLLSSYEDLTDADDKTIEDE